MGNGETHDSLKPSAEARTSRRTTTVRFEEQKAQDKAYVKVVPEELEHLRQIPNGTTGKEPGASPS